MIRLWPESRYEALDLMSSWTPTLPEVETPSTPSLLVPAGAGDLAAHYDLTLSHPSSAAETFAAFEGWLAQAAARRGLSCALLQENAIEEAIRRLGAGTLRIAFHLDYFAEWHDPEDRYARLAQAVQDAGGHPVNSPARARAFTDKAAAHAELLRHGLGVPATVILRPWVADRALTSAERARLGLDEPGTRVFIKPANGFGSHGVVCVDHPMPENLAAALSAARNHDRRDTYLIQREVLCARLPGENGSQRAAYWRVLYCRGDVLPFWWTSQAASPNRPSYQWLSAGEVRRHHLQPVAAFMRRLAELSGLDWFSSEICLSEGCEESCFMVPDRNGRLRPLVAIDYLNDQCHVDVQSRWPGAPPDAVVRYAAEQFARAAADYRLQNPQPVERPCLSRAA